MAKQNFLSGGFYGKLGAMVGQEYGVIMGTDYVYDANGNRMVESIYWKSGNVEYRHRSNHETGDGWYVLASQFALEALKDIGNLYSHQHVSRGLEAASFTPISSEAKSFII